LPDDPCSDSNCDCANLLEVKECKLVFYLIDFNSVLVMKCNLTNIQRVDDDLFRDIIQENNLQQLFNENIVNQA
jgi:hypothetical protein